MYCLSDNNYYVKMFLYQEIVMLKSMLYDKDF